MNLFSAQQPQGNFGNDLGTTEGLKMKFQRLERLKKQELARWWDGITLQQYLNNSRIPRGLRILIFPIFEDLDDELLKEWKGNLSNSSVTMMRILIRHSEKKAASLMMEIEKLENEIEESPLKEVIKNYEVLEKIIEEYQIYQRDKKSRKIKRDENDYREGRVYTFAKNYDTIRNTETPKRGREQTSDSGSVSDNAMTSMESILTPSNSSNPTQPQVQNSFLLEMERLRLNSKQPKKDQKQGGEVRGGPGKKGVPGLTVKLRSAKK